MNRNKPRPRAEAQKVDELPDTFYRLRSLLQTVRCIAQHEDALCTLLHEIKEARSLSKESAHELLRLLAELPAHEYGDDLEALEHSVAQPGLPAA